MPRVLGLSRCLRVLSCSNPLPSKTMTDPEFKVVDTVTFKPYDTAHRVQVMEICPNRFGDGRMIYHVRAPYSRRISERGVVINGPVLSYTPGEHIVESKLYEPWQDTTKKPA